MPARPSFDIPDLACHRNFVNDFRPSNVSHGVTGVRLRVWHVIAVGLMVLGAGAASPLAGALAAGQQGAGSNGASRPPSRQGGPGTPSAAAQNPGQQYGWTWWNDPDVRKKLALSDDKAVRLQRIFEHHVPEMQAWWDAAQKENAVLDQMTKDMVADLDTYEVEVAKVQALFARFREAQTIVVYQIYRELQPDQLKKLLVIRQERFDQARGRGGMGGGR
jgi:hypothetical protein